MIFTITISMTIDIFVIIQSIIIISFSVIIFKIKYHMPFPVFIPHFLRECRMPENLDYCQKLLKSRQWCWYDLFYNIRCSVNIVFLYICFITKRLPIYIMKVIIVHFCYSRFLVLLITLFCLSFSWYYFAHFSDWIFLWMSQLLVNRDKVRSKCFEKRFYRKYISAFSQLCFWTNISLKATGQGRY